MTDVADTEEGTVDKTLAQEATQATNMNGVMEGLDGDTDSAAATIERKAVWALGGTPGN